MTGAISEAVSWAAPISTLVGAIATAILMWASYNWPAGKHRKDKDEDSGKKDAPKKKGKKTSDRYYDDDTMD